MEHPPRERRVRGFVRRHRKAAALVVVLALTSGSFAVYWFAPWTLFIDRTVNEALPIVPAPSVGPSIEARPSAARVLSSGSFRSIEHGTSGIARIVVLADGSRIVRFEDFRTSNGPDVVVQLSGSTVEQAVAGEYSARTLLLGGLKGNVGSQNYAIPPSVDVSEYHSVLVWCRRFSVGFGVAPITLA